jgi:OOP family OmpA-OmpF porin
MGMKTVVAALVLLGAGAALAQTAPTIELEQLSLDPAARGSLLVGNGQTLKGGTFRVSAALQYTNAQLRNEGTTLLRDRFALHVLGAVGITHWLELSGDVPVIVHQVAESGAFRVSSAGLGTPFIHAKIAILGETAPVALWTSLGLGIPVGTAGALGNGGLTFTPRLNLGRNFDRVQLGVELGALIRGVGYFVEPTFSADRPPNRGPGVGSQLYASIAAGQLREGLRAEISVRAFTSLTGTPGGMELLFGARYPHKDVEFFVVGGPGFGGEPTTPKFRLYLGAAFGNGGPPLPRCTESVAYALDECPQLDRDLDGVLNGVDAAPLKPEDKDGFQDEDGAPDPDNDADGVLDPADGCRDVKGPKENGGCPELAPSEP